jgi:hypothetical protein
MFRKLVLSGCVLCAAIALTGAPREAVARSGVVAATAIGPRIGFGVGPDQVVIGGHMSFGGFHPDWTLSPIVEIGFGDHVTVTTVDFDAYYHVRLADSEWRPYVGGGVSINNFNFDETPPFRHASDTEAGLNFVFGTSIPVATNAPMFAELRLGLGDIPDLRGMFGWNFPLGR